MTNDKSSRLLLTLLKARGIVCLQPISPGGLGFFLQSRTDILLTDVLMPDKNGFELALEIKQRWPDCRLLLFSGHATTAQLATECAGRFTAAGYRFELLPKPLPPEQLLKYLEQTLACAA